MRPIKVVTDSGADLPAALIEELDVSVVTLVVVARDQAFNETELPREDFWRLLEEQIRDMLHNFRGRPRQRRALLLLQAGTRILEI